MGVYPFGVAMMRWGSIATHPALHPTPHDSKTAPKRRNAFVRDRHHLLKYGRRHVERLTPHPFPAETKRESKNATLPDAES